MTAEIEAEIGAVYEATRRVVRRVDQLGDNDFAAPSLLPGWSRSHVVAHLALNAEGLAGVLQGLATGLATGVDTPMYASPQQRDADIEQLARATPSVLRDRFLASCTAFHDAVQHLPADAWDARFVRVPGADPWAVRDVPGLRLRELEIHHVDLRAGYSPGDWPDEVRERILATVVADRATGPGVVLRTPEGDVPVGAGAGPVVSGSRADLTWWLLGRGEGDGLTGDPEVPRLAPWR